MRVKEVPLEIELLSASLVPMGVGRSKGVHLGEVIRWTREKLEGEYASHDDEGMVRLAAGFLWERVWEEQVAQYFRSARSHTNPRLVHQQEYQRDNVFVTIDTLDIKDRCVEEYKLTWRSLKKLVEGGVVAGLERYFWTWLLQIKAQCHVTGVTKARLVVFFINGDYSFKGPLAGPQLRVLLLEFTRPEIKEAWQVVLKNAEAMLKERGAA